MSKIIVPQELQQQIIELYQEGKTRKDIRTLLETPFGDSVIKRILIDNGCEIRTNPGAQKGGRKKEDISLEEQKKVIELYGQGYGQTYIANHMDGTWSGDKIKRVLKDNGIQIRDFQEALEVKPEDEADLRKHKINDDYNFVSHNGAWIMGFLAADGYLPDTRGARNRVVLSLARKDEEVLYRIKNELGFSGPIYQFTSRGFPTSSLTFNSKKIRQVLESYGIVNNKTFKLDSIPKELPKEYVLDYIRGFFDGDGSIIRSSSGKVSMSITCASKTFLQSIAVFLHEEYNLPLPIIGRDHDNYVIRYYKKSTLVLGDLFYNNDYLALKRKKDHYFEILQEAQRK